MRRNFNNERLIGKAATWSRRDVAKIAAFISAWMIFYSTLAAAQQAAPNDKQKKSNPSPSSNTVTVPTGTRMRVRMIDPVDSETNRASDRFRGELDVDFMAGDVLVAPQGTTVYGRLLTAESAGSRSGGELELDITEILIDGTLHSLMTSSKQVQGAEGSSAGSTAARGAGAGGVAGGVLGAGVGFGARAGAVVGGISGAKARGESVKVPAGAIVDFTLDHPVSLPTMQR
jgi:hypothetical protein